MSDFHPYPDGTTIHDIFQSEFLVANEMPDEWRDTLTIQAVGHTKAFNPRVGKLETVTVVVWNGNKDARGNPYKKWILNVGNSEAIAAQHGKVVNGWRGKSVTLFKTQEKDKRTGELMDVIRVAPTNTPKPNGAEKTATATAGNGQTVRAPQFRSTPLLSPVQRTKLLELWRILRGGDANEEGLNELFVESFKHGIAEATYEEGARLTGQLLAELRNKANAPTVVPGVPPLPEPVKILSKQNGGNGTGDALTKLRELETKFGEKTYTEQQQRDLKQQIVFALKLTAIGDDGDLRHALRVELFGENWGWHQLEALKLWLMSEGAKKYVAHFVAKRVAMANADAQAVPSKQQITPEQIGMIVKALSQSHGGDIDAAAHAADEMFRKKFGYAMNRGTSEDYEAVMQEIEKDPTYIPF